MKIILNRRKSTKSVIFLLMNIVLKIIALVVSGWLAWVFVININAASPSVKAGLIGLLGMFSVALVTNYQTRKREIDARHFADKREGYMKFIDLIFDFIISSRNGKELTEREMLPKIILFKKTLLIWGAPNIIKSWNNFEIKSDEGLNSEEMLQEMEKILREIRKDLGHDDTQLKPGSLSGLFIIAEEKEKLLGEEF